MIVNIMNLFLSLLLSVLIGHLSGVVKSDGLIAISTGSNVSALYYRIRHADNVSPPEPDRAYTDANFRKSICEEITGSGYFPADEGLFPVNMEPNALSEKLEDDELFARLYKTIPPRNDSSILKKLPTFLSSGKQKPTFEYQNFFAPREFEFDHPDGRTTQGSEDVFVCLLEDKKDGKVRPYYVTKEYNVVGDPFRAGRFILTVRRARVPSIDIFYTQLFLAEAPAKVFKDPKNPKYDVELKYLERRSHLPLAPDDASDPVCTLLPELGSENYGDRLCALVMTSSDFQRTTVQYLESLILPKCVEITVSFQSRDAKRIAGERVYRERALQCRCRDSALNYRKNHVYITRAYTRNEVFVWEYDFEEGKIFLKNLTIDVGLVRGGVTVLE